jgi:hypothetical protein
MKKLVFASIALFLSGVAPAGAKLNDFGAGIIIGDGIGITGRYNISKNNSLEGVFSMPAENKLSISMDYVWNDYKALPAPDEGSLALIYGGGVSIRDGGQLGIRGKIGIEYVFEKYPFDLFLEIAPVLKLVPTTGMYFSGGIGGRYFFE